MLDEGVKFNMVKSMLQESKKQLDMGDKQNIRAAINSYCKNAILRLKDIIPQLIGSQFIDKCPGLVQKSIRSCRQSFLENLEETEETKQYRKEMEKKMKDLCKLQREILSIKQL